MVTTINLCQLVFSGRKREESKDPEQAVPLLESQDKELQEVEAHKLEAGDGDAVKCPEAKKATSVSLIKTVNRSMDTFKGILVIFMTFSHVDLCLMPLQEQYYEKGPHFIGNMASSLCFLGFMFAYGYSCDLAYLSDFKKRSSMERLVRLVRSASLPMVGAVICNCAWGFECWKAPITYEGMYDIVTFQKVLGNGPDFLVCFTVALMTMSCFRSSINTYLCPEATEFQQGACAFAMLAMPLALTYCIIPDCTGSVKYLNYLFECSVREQFAPNLPALPHLFYFNLGVLASRYAIGTEEAMKFGAKLVWKKLTAVSLALACFFLILHYPLATVWSGAYGNIQVKTTWGMITRGFNEGPSFLWLVGNLFPIYATLVACIGIQVAVAQWPRVSCLLNGLLGELQHLGANVLLYLICGDVALSGLWRGRMNQYPLDFHGCAAMTLGLFGIVRFVHYLGASSRL